jgi:tetratricopeptide (TPR) repeat protein
LTPDSGQPRVVVIDAVDQADQDCLAALSYVVRSLENLPITLVLRTSGRALGGPWDRLLPNLIAKGAAVRVDGDRLEHDQNRPLTEWSSSLEYGLACCRAGALHTGSRVLATELANGNGDLPTATEANSWQVLAMAMLRLRQFRFVSTAVAGAMALDPAVQQRRLLRRILMFALRGLGESDALRKLGGVALHELNSQIGDPAEEAWLQLDAALGCSLDDPEGRHVRLLESIVDRADRNVSAQCRAAAHLWLAAFRTIGGDAQGAVGHQRVGLSLLKALHDESRALSTRVRLGAALFGLGNYGEAAAHFETAARRAIGPGEFEMAAECLCYAARSYVAIGNSVRAEILLDGPLGSRHDLWSPRRARLLRLHALAVLALARGEAVAAEAMAQSLVEELTGGAGGESEWTARISCECAYLLADIAASRGEILEVRQWLLHGLRMCEHAAVEERPGLIARGKARLLGQPSQ